MHLFLEAIDVWLFRDGRPFDARSDHRATSMFPPYPTVIQGAIRSHHLMVKDVDLRNPKLIESVVGTTDDYGSLRLRGPFLAKRENSKIVRYLPVPAHAMPTEDGYVALAPEQVPSTVKTSAPTPLLLWPKGEPVKSEGGAWLREDHLRAFFQSGSLSLDTVMSDKAFFEKESRLGIARNEQRTTEEGALYEVEFIRPWKNAGLLVEVEGYDGWPSQGVMRIGDEGRAARFEQVSSPPLPSPSTGEGEDERQGTSFPSVSPWVSSLDPLLPEQFFIYFATPTYFTSGWLPESWGKFFDGEVTLQAAALHRFQSLGGFDWAKNPKDPTAHKPARRYVPAGAVYFFKSQGQTRLKLGLTQNAITDFGAEIGFGQVLIERW